MQGRENLLCLTVWASISSPLESKTSSEERITFMKREKERMKKKTHSSQLKLHIWAYTKSSHDTTRHGTTYIYSGMKFFSLLPPYRPILTIRRMQTKQNTHSTEVHIIENHCVIYFRPKEEVKKKSELSWYHFLTRAPNTHILAWFFFCSIFYLFPKMLLYHLKAVLSALQ